MVFLLGRFGDTKEALTLIINELKDMQYAIAFCHEHGDPELWTDLIDHCVDKPGRIKVDSNLVITLISILQNLSRSCYKVSETTLIRLL